MDAGRVFWAARKGTAHPVPHVITVLIGKSTQISAGDVLVLDVGSSVTTGSIPVARPLFSGDTVTTSNGLLGVAPYAMKTDSSGNITTPSYPITVDTKGKITPQLLSIPNALPSDPASLYTQVWIWSFDPSNLFEVVTQANDVANYYLVGRSLGVGVSASSAPANYYADDDAAAANAPWVCEAVDTSDPQYNSANGLGRIWVSCKSSFYQRNTGGFFST